VSFAQQREMKLEGKGRFATVADCNDHGILYFHDGSEAVDRPSSEYRREWGRECCPSAKNPDPFENLTGGQS
jgi:hypothetical protein